VLARQQQCIVGRGVAGVQRGQQVDAGWQLGLHDVRLDKAHALVAKPLRALAAALNPAQASILLNRSECRERRAGTARTGRTEISISGARVDEDGFFVTLEHIAQAGLEELNEVVHLLELAQAVRVQGAVARDQVQLFEELHRLARAPARAALDRP
jgi:hypothetical protein